MDHRKSGAERKEASILVRVTAKQKRDLTAAAQRKGMGVSVWLRSLGLEALRKGSAS